MNLKGLDNIDQPLPTNQHPSIFITMANPQINILTQIFPSCRYILIDSKHTKKKNTKIRKPTITFLSHFISNSVFQQLCNYRKLFHYYYSTKII